jgi:hypothetical protein
MYESYSFVHGLHLAQFTQRMCYIAVDACSVKLHALHTLTLVLQLYIAAVCTASSQGNRLAYTDALYTIICCVILWFTV